jgi:GDP-L-fucose synthase
MTLNALVTGGGGFVGRHVCKKLHNEGYNITCIDNLSAEGSLHPFFWPKHLKCVNIDDCDPVVVSDSFSFFKRDIKEYFQSFQEKRFDLVVHLAAIVGGRMTIENAPLAVGEDLAIDALFFVWLTKACPEKIVYFSSSAAYPINNQTEEHHLLLKEDMIDFDSGNLGMADMTYGWTKLTGEYLAKLAYEKYNMNIVCFRPFSGYGEDQHATYPFPAILKRVLNKESPIKIWSDTVRDFIYIDDCVDAMLLALKNEQAMKCMSFNLGSSIATSFSELAKKMCEIHGHEANIEIMNNMPKGVKYRVCDNSLTKNVLNFVPKVSLQQGIEKCIKFQNK